MDGDGLHVVDGKGRLQPGELHELEPRAVDDRRRRDPRQAGPRDVLLRGVAALDQERVARGPDPVASRPALGRSASATPVSSQEDQTRASKKHEERHDSDGGQSRHISEP